MAGWPLVEGEFNRPRQRSIYIYSISRYMNGRLGGDAVLNDSIINSTTRQQVSDSAKSIPSRNVVTA